MKAAELAGRFEAIATALDHGVVVLWDKYIVGSIVADIARSVPSKYTDALLSSLPEPDLTVYLEITPAEALRRKSEIGGPRVMESGLDVTFGARQAHAKMAAGEIDPDTMARHFLAFQTRMSEVYARHLPPGRTLRLDAGRSPVELAESIVQARQDTCCSNVDATNRFVLAEPETVMHNIRRSRPRRLNRSA